MIYVSPIELNEETLQYYSKLFALRAAVESGNPKDYADVSTRYKIVVPEALNKFPVFFFLFVCFKLSWETFYSYLSKKIKSHQMALSTVLKYSPQAIERYESCLRF